MNDAAGDAVDSAWEALRRAWDDPEAHGRFAELCAQVDRLGDGARLYRAHLDARPDDAPARAALDQLQARAMRSLVVEPAVRNRQWIEGSRRSIVGLLVVMAVALAVAFLIFFAWRCGGATSAFSG